VYCKDQQKSPMLQIKLEEFERLQAEIRQLQNLVDLIRKIICAMMLH
jgi:hypothetical protein